MPLTRLRRKYFFLNPEELRPIQLQYQKRWILQHLKDLITEKHILPICQFSSSESVSSSTQDKSEVEGRCFSSSSIFTRSSSPSLSSRLRLNKNDLGIFTVFLFLNSFSMRLNERFSKKSVQESQ